MELIKHSLYSYQDIKSYFGKWHPQKTFSHPNGDHNIIAIRDCEEYYNHNWWIYSSDMKTVDISVVSKSENPRLVKERQSFIGQICNDNPVIYIFKKRKSSGLYEFLGNDWSFYKISNTNKDFRITLKSK